MAAGHTRKGPRSQKKVRLRGDPTKRLISELLEWKRGGGLALYEKDFSQAPIARMFGMPYRPLFSPQDVARLRGNSHGDRYNGPQDEAEGNPNGGLSSSDPCTGR